KKFRSVEEGQIGGSGWESNPSLRGSARSQTALKAAQVTRPESLPRLEKNDSSRGAESARNGFRHVIDQPDTVWTPVGPCSPPKTDYIARQRDDKCTAATHLPARIQPDG